MTELSPFSTLPGAALFPPVQIRGELSARAISPHRTSGLEGAVPVEVTWQSIETDEVDDEWQSQGNSSEASQSSQS